MKMINWKTVSVKWKIKSQVDICLWQMGAQMMAARKGTSGCWLIRSSGPDQGPESWRPHRAAQTTLLG